MRSLFLLLLVCAALASACRASAGSSEPTPIGSWELVELPGIDLTALGEPPALVIGADGALSGYGGVNQFSGKSDAEELRAGRLHAGPLIATRRAGPPAAMEAEAHFLALLESALEWHRREGALELVQDGAVKARLVPTDRRH